MKYRPLHFHYLPAYHPELNYQEILWRTIRYEETTHAFFETIEDLKVSVFKRSQRWKPKKIKSLCQLTKDFYYSKQPRSKLRGIKNQTLTAHLDGTLYIDV